MIFQSVDIFKQSLEIPTNPIILVLVRNHTSYAVRSSITLLTMYLVCSALNVSSIDEFWLLLLNSSMNKYFMAHLCLTASLYIILSLHKSETKQKFWSWNEAGVKL